MQDGVAENFTAGLLEPYLDGCGGQTANSGRSYVEPEELRGYVTRHRGLADLRRRRTRLLRRPGKRRRLGVML
jgi:hypothetical protein